MSKKDFIPIPPPAPLPDAEHIEAKQLLDLYSSGDIDLICVMGPTASGKTRYAVCLARELNRLLAEGNSVGETSDNGTTMPPLKGVAIISADSRQVFRGMDIGTGKDLSEYGEIPHKLIDIADPGDKYSIYEYQRDFSAAYGECRSNGMIPILCGGSGLYVEAATKPEYQLGENVNLGLTFPKRTFYLATLVSREVRRERIDRRLMERLDEGMVEEIKGLLDGGVTPETLIRYGLEYKFVTLYLLGQMPRDEMVFHLQNVIHQFAKRQMTWLRGMEKDGIRIHWVEAEKK